MIVLIFGLHFVPDKNSLNFGDLLSNVAKRIRTFRNKFEIGDVEFRISIEEIYFKIQNFLNEASSLFLIILSFLFITQTYLFTT